MAQNLLPVPSYDPPAISVIIPVGPYHRGVFMDAVDSVDAQSFRFWECIVVNDTGQQLPPMPAWVKVVQQPDFRLYGGVAAARNAGISASRASWFLPLDADDLLEPSCLEIMFRTGRGTKDFIYSDFWEDPQEKGRWQVFKTLDYDASQYLDASIGQFHTVTALTRKEHWEAVGGYPEDLTCWEDYAFALLLAEKGVCGKRISLPLFTYRKWAGQRRNDNIGRKDEYRAAFEARFGQYAKGEELMACRSCRGKGRADIPQLDMPHQGADPGASRDGMTLVAYTGPRVGISEFRGKASGTMYTFSKDETRYVHDADLAGFERHKDFRVVPMAEIQSLAAVVGATEPTLQSSNPEAEHSGSVPPDEPDEGPGNPIAPKRNRKAPAA